MTFTQTCTISASRNVVWDFLMQAENVARCLVGVEAFKQLDQDNYEGTLRVKVGPIALALQGTIAGPGPKDAASFIQSFSGNHRFVLDYLLEEVLHQQPERVQRFLLRTSVLHRLCGPL